MTVVTYTVDNVAEMFEVSSRTISDYIRNGKIKAVKIGHAYFISEDNLRDFVNGNTSNTTNNTMNLTLDMIIRRAIARKDKKPFEIKDLFPSTYWDNNDPQHRRNLGREFRLEVEIGDVRGVSFNDKKSDNHTTYKKK